jgi:hypothetical protein
MASQGGRCLLLHGTGPSACVVLAQPSLAASCGLRGIASCCRAGTWLLTFLLLLLLLLLLLHRWLPLWQHVQLCELRRPDEAACCMARAAGTCAVAAPWCIINRRQDG